MNASQVSEGTNCLQYRRTAVNPLLVRICNSYLRYLYMREARATRLHWLALTTTLETPKSPTVLAEQVLWHAMKGTFGTVRKSMYVIRIN